MHIFQYSCEWIGTHWEFFLYTNQHTSSKYNEMIGFIQQTIMQFESDYSRFTDTSLVWKLNHHRTIETDNQEFWGLLRFCEYLTIITDGYFDIKVWGILEDLWYDAEYSFTEKKQKKAGVHQATLSEQGSNIEIIWNTITLKGNANIDLGGIGKGFLIRKIGQGLLQQGVESFCINAWGDIWTYGSDCTQPILIQHPTDTSLILGQLETKKGCFAASWALYRSRGKGKHHLIDPHTHQPVKSPILSVHTYHPSDIVLADLASTVLFVCPHDSIPVYASRLGVEYMAISNDLSIVCSKWYPSIINN